MISTCIFPTSYSLEQIEHAKNTLGLEAVILYTGSWSRSNEVKEMGLRVGGFGGRTVGHWINSTPELDFLFLGDEPNVTGPSGAYLSPQKYYSDSLVTKKALREEAGYKGPIISGALGGVGGIFEKWWSKVDTGYLQKIIEFERLDPVFDAYGLNPFHMNIPRALRDMKSVIGDAPIYTAGFGFNNHSYDDKIAMWFGAFSRQIKALEADPQVVTTSTWCAGVYESLKNNQPMGKWGHINLDGSLTISGRHFQKGVMNK